MTRETAKTKSRWLPWLVVLGMFIVLVVLPFGIWLAVQSHRASQFRQAVGAIRALGGEVAIDKQGGGPEWLRSLLGEHFFPRAGLAWYPSNAGDEDLVHLRCLPGMKTLSLTGTRVTDAGLAEVARLHDLGNLHVRGTAITDVGVAQLLALEQLSILSLDYTVVTDEGLQALARLPRLQELSVVDTNVTKEGASRFAAARSDVSLTWRALSSETHRRAAVALLRSGAYVDFDDHTTGEACTSVRVVADEPADPLDFSNLENLDDLRSLAVRDRLDVAKLEILGRLHGLEYLSFDTISDSGLAHLKGLKNLKTLALRGTQITNAGLAHLKNLTNLESLDLNNTQITDAGLEHLRTLANLELLDLSDTRIADAGLEHLKHLTKLESLWLSSTQITDAGLVHLRSLVMLRFLELWRNTQVTDGAVVRLGQALPNVSISREYSGYDYSFDDGSTEGYPDDSMDDGDDSEGEIIEEDEEP
ncbi:MAG: leucine-rich repeat domain-containing protein [Planctomycetota bacterium]|jgi:Leucine-rich repeat (LRR) protein